jgi:hypothetical protein
MTKKKTGRQTTRKWPELPHGPPPPSPPLSTNRNEVERKKEKIDGPLVLFFWLGHATFAQLVSPAHFVPFRAAKVVTNQAECLFRSTLHEKDTTCWRAGET